VAEPPDEGKSPTTDAFQLSTRGDLDVARPVAELATHRSGNVQACKRRAGSTYDAAGDDLWTLVAAATGSDYGARATSIRRWYWARIRDLTAPRRARTVAASIALPTAAVIGQ